MSLCKIWHFVLYSEILHNAVSFTAKKGEGGGKGRGWCQDIYEMKKSFPL